MLYDYESIWNYVSIGVIIKELNKNVYSKILIVGRTLFIASIGKRLDIYEKASGKMF